MRALWLASAALLAAPLSAQDHSGHSSHGAHSAPEVDHCAMGHLPPEQCPPSDEDNGHQDHTDHAAHGQNDSAENDHTGHGDHSAHGAATDSSVPGASPEDAVPDRAFDGPRHAADAIWGADAMQPSRDDLKRHHGGQRLSFAMIERLELRVPTDGEGVGYLWDAQGFYGGDVDRLVIKTEGEGDFDEGIEESEIQALFSRAVGPFFDLQAGVRFDPGPDTRSHLIVGAQGLSPYEFEVDTALFLSDRGDLTARLEAEYDQRIMQQLILQPRIEIELSAQDIPERDIGFGITSIEPGLRLRYEIRPEFAPYIGLEYEAALGQTADIARAEGDDPDGLKVLVGLRAWF